MENKNNIKIINDTELEHCVICKKITIYPKNTHIDYRLYYIEGVGQMCTECYEIIYDKNDEI